MSNKPNTGPRNFGVFLSQIEDGVLQADLSEELKRVTAELSTHAQRTSRKAKGSITLTINLAHDETGVVDVDCEVKSKTPKTSRARSVFWNDGHDNLSSKNPKQETLNFKSVPSDSPAKDISVRRAETKEVANG